MYIFAVTVKKLFVFILAFTYLAEASGMSLYKHFCMNRLVSWGLTKGGKNCPSCGMEKDHPGKSECKGCCKDEHKIIKLTGDHKAEFSIWSIALFGEAIPSFSLVESSVSTFGIKSTWNSIHAPPLYNGVPVYLFNCVFLI